MKEVYRSCAAVMVFQPSPRQAGATAGKSTSFNVLLLHKPRKNDAWQLPQGGVETGESIGQAALRELKEEAGLVAEIIGQSQHVYQYDFPESFRRFRPDNVKGQRVEFVFAQLSPEQPVQVDNEEIDDYRWVTTDQLSEYIKRSEYLQVIEQLIKEGERLL